MPYTSTLGSLYHYSGSLLPVNGGSVLSTNILNYTSHPHTATFIDDNGVLSTSGTTTASINGGPQEAVTYVGTGMAYTLKVPILNTLLNAVPITIFIVGGKTYLYAPSGLPPLSDLVFSYDLTTNSFPLPSPRPICFANGTRLLTDQGVMRIEDLRPGMRLATLDRGFQPLRWIGTRQVTRLIQRLSPSTRAVRVAKGALGDGLPERDLLLTLQHRVMIRGPNGAEALIAVKHLIGRPGIMIAPADQNRTYYHLLFDHHEILSSEGIAAESLYLGPRVGKILGPEAMGHIHGILTTTGAELEPARARPFLTAQDMHHSRDAPKGVSFRATRTTKPQRDLSLAEV